MPMTGAQRCDGCGLDIDSTDTFCRFSEVTNGWLQLNMGCDLLGQAVLMWVSNPRYITYIFGLCLHWPQSCDRS